MSSASKVPVPQEQEMLSQAELSSRFTPSEKRSYNSIRDHTMVSSQPVSVDDTALKHVDPSTHNKISIGEATVVIKRKYEFAGETMEEEKTVPASSAEARLYLEEQARKKQSIIASTSNSKPALRRPTKRASIFGTGGGATSAPVVASSKGPKLNTIEKSKLDWAAHVDQEGISDELDEHRRAKGTYLGRLDFLGRMDAKRDEELSNVKKK